MALFANVLRMPELESNTLPPDTALSGGDRSNTRAGPGSSASAPVDALVQKLVAHIVRRRAHAYGDDEEARAAIQNGKEYCLRLLQSRMTAYSLPTAIDDAQRLLVQKDLCDRAVQFSAIVNRLRALGVKSTNSTVYALLQLSPLYRERSVAVQTSILDLMPRRTASHPQTRALQLATPSGRAVQAKARVDSTEMGEDDADMGEEALVREALFALQGIEGEYFALGVIDGQRAFEVRARGVPRRCVSVMHTIAYTGTLYLGVKEKADRLKRGRHGELYVQAMCGAVQQELTEYYRLVALLETKLNGTTVAEGGQRTVGGGLSMLALYSWCRKPTFVLMTLRAALNGVQKRYGVQRLAYLYDLSRHGDQAVGVYLGAAKANMGAVLMDMVYRWVRHGQLVDPEEEFFIQCNPACSPTCAGAWAERYTLRDDMLPPFLPLDVCQAVLALGKMVNFLQDSCEEYDAQHALREHARQIEEMSRDALAVDRLKNDVTAAHMVRGCSILLQFAAQLLGRRLVAILMDEYRLMEHLRFIHEFVLLQRGAFLVRVLPNLNVELSKPHKRTYAHNVLSAVHAAAREVVEEGSRSEVLVDHLDIRIAESGLLGWDGFGLSYSMTTPLSCVITEQHLDGFVNVSRALLQLKRMEIILSTIWKPASGEYLRGDDDQSAWLRCMKFRHELATVVAALQQHVVVDVLKSEWALLLRSMDKVEDMDMIIAVIGQFVCTVSRDALLIQEGDTVGVGASTLHSLVDVVLRFNVVQREFAAGRSEREMFVGQLKELDGELHSALDALCEMVRGQLDHGEDTELLRTLERVRDMSCTARNSV